ncbi:MAG: DUF177 domain-containing protein [Bacteroidota bacterium]|nr:DUF177 domain-containing protein [Candidatus Kapabacteria bacterium]MDW8219903.1 DUF177 domain-containing protein [Bacteroidota bacterium]
MITVSIKGLRDGKHPIEATEQCSAVAHLAQEFIGIITVKGTLRKHGKRYLLTITAEAPASLTCDISGEEFIDTISTTFELEYIANTTMANLHARSIEREPPYYIREDATCIDITDDVRQELTVSLPMKRIAPQHHNKDFAELFPQFTQQDDITANEHTIDPRWAALKSITFDQ